MGNKQKPDNKHEIVEKNVFSTIEWQENTTILDLSKRGITSFDENVKLPPNLVELCLSNNNFIEVPNVVLNLDYLKTLDMSYNNIVLFDETPKFCHTLESLNLSNNKLEGPPYWVWSEQPKSLSYLNLSDNGNLRQCFGIIDHYLEELLQYNILVKNIDLHNCRLGNHIKLMSTFRRAKVVTLGSLDYNYLSANFIESLPCIGLQDCGLIEVLNVSNTNVYNIQNNIDIYKNLIELNLSQNNINSLPNEFCNLENLEICILSFNKILYLPDNMHMLKKLKKLYLDNNELCMLPESLSQLGNLKVLDLYNNHLYEGFEDISHLEEYDFAQNYDEEPDNHEYSEKKRKLRENYSGRLDGRAPDRVHEETDEQETDEDCYEDSTQSELQAVNVSRCSTPEDWDSDDYWIPSPMEIPTPSNMRRFRHNVTPPTSMRWLEFVKRKMAEGNFCPMDMHLATSITDMVKYEKLHNPKPQLEVEGQFDDYSEDDS